MRFRALLEYFGSAEEAWRASAAQLQQAGLSEKVIDNLLQLRSRVNLEQLVEKYLAQGIAILTWEDDAYPRRLREIEQPPPVLYARGQVTVEDEWAVAIVGTRRITPYGRQVTEEMSRVFARSGVTVVSGLARGVDAIAHQTALNTGGRTLAVLGSGVDRIYPPENQRLAEQMAACGAVLSDYAPGTPPDGPNFPPRNRIISGLSLAVVVVEAGEDSGALITAEFAAQQGREIFAVPGNIYAPQSIGANRLIAKGAKPLLSAQDVLEALDLLHVTEQRAARTALPADPIEAQVFDQLNFEPQHVDELRARTGIPIEKVSAALTMMELKGMARQVGGMNYVRLRETQDDYLTGEDAKNG